MANPAPLAVLGMALALVVATWPQNPADAQFNSRLRSGTRNITRAITEQTRRIFKPKLVVKQGATGPVTWLSMSADSSRLLTVLGDQSARLWDLDQGILLHTFANNQGGVRVGVISPDNATVALAGNDGSIRLNRAELGTERARLSGHRGAVLALAQSTDGKVLVSGGEDGTVRTWDPVNGTPLNVYRGHDGPVRAVSVNHDGSIMASGSGDRTVRLWRADNERAVRTFTGHDGAVTSVAFGRDYATVISGSEDRVINVWDISSAKHALTIRGHVGAVTTIQVSESGEFVVSGGSDNVVRMWDLKDGRMVKELKGHDDAVRAVVFDLGKKRILSASDDGTTKVWNIDSGVAFVQMIATVAGWAIVDRDGRFDGTEDALKDVHWADEQDSFALDSFSQDYYEPGLLAKHLDNSAGFINADVTSVPDGVYLPPKVSFAGEIDPTPAADGLIAVTVVAEDQGGGIEGIRLYHNGKLVGADRVTADQTSKDRRSHRRTVSYRVPPTGGANRFEAFGIGAENIEGSIATAVVDVPIAKRKPTLHVLVIGINNYAAEELKLDYSKSDALAIALALSRSSGELYSDVIAYQLLDQDATGEAIRKAFTIVEKVPSEDVLMVYLAGHGVTVDNEWYFLPYEYDSSTFDNLLTVEVGISSAELQDALVKTGAGRVIVAIDSCYSGAAVQNIRNFAERKALRDLGRAVGVHVLAATRADQVAYEFPVLRQGLLTYTILQGLAGPADASGDGLVSAAEMIAFTKDMLPRIARRDYPSINQTPVAYSRGQDFQVYKSIN